MSRFRVLQGAMEQRTSVVRDIVFTCVVLHNMIRTHQGGYQHQHVAALQKEHMLCVPNKELQESFDGGQISTRTSERLLQSHGT